ncbi:hypothetical protein Nepgr_011578 [Nepenthes gracilis]|uniref:Uncharacterized protein n=1 Tax=Nepenthes gracilis TaxID=150966 RepID=A0AAD3SFR2_NEPGR|nr:hypothetical protein Nepgr_011578 [Nepenthes gracilis]
MLLPIISFAVEVWVYSDPVQSGLWSCIVVLPVWSLKRLKDASIGLDHGILGCDLVGSCCRWLVLLSVPSGFAMRIGAEALQVKVFLQHVPDCCIGLTGFFEVGGH